MPLDWGNPHPSRLMQYAAVEGVFPAPMRNQLFSIQVPQPRSACGIWPRRHPLILGNAREKIFIAHNHESIFFLNACMHKDGEDMSMFSLIKFIILGNARDKIFIAHNHESIFFLNACMHKDGEDMSMFSPVKFIILGNARAKIFITYDHESIFFLNACMHKDGEDMSMFSWSALHYKIIS
jgi:hypothetical protein